MTINEQVKLVVDLTGQYYNHWPNLKILLNNGIIFDGEIIDNQVLTFELDCFKTNQLKFVHYGKQFGENGVWDSDPNSEKTCFININDIKFNAVSIGEKVKSELIFRTNWSKLQHEHNANEFIDTYSDFQCHGAMNFNGEINLQFDTPVYNWLTFSKYKVPLTDTAYFSNYSSRWHYEEDLQVIEEIKELLNFDKNSNT